MKKFLFILALMLTVASPLPTQATPKAQVARSGDTTTIIADGDTLKFTDSAVKSAIKNAVNDTIWNEGRESEYDREVTERTIAYRWADVAQLATTLFIICVVSVVFLCLLFYFLHRRAKYRVIEKAIENNYPLPPSLGGMQPFTPTTPQQPDAWRPAAPKATLQSSAYPDTGNTTPAQEVPMYYRANYRAYKSSVTLICVGMALALFFLFNNAEPLACLMLMISFLGLGKGLIIYKEQQQDRAYWQWQMQQQASAPRQQAPSKPTDEEQPPVFNQPIHTDDK